MAIRSCSAFRRPVRWWLALPTVALLAAGCGSGLADGTGDSYHPDGYAAGAVHGADYLMPPDPGSSCRPCHGNALQGRDLAPACANCHGEEEIHPAGWADPVRHGYAWQADPAGCAGCHGTGLTGGRSGVSCDRCHPGGSSWRTDCTFCHGGPGSPLGAPPEGVRGETDPTDRHVGAHAAHVSANYLHAGFDCAVCHVRPVSAFDAGHVDGTAGVVFSGAAGASAAYTPASTGCRNVYCHGDGRTAGSVEAWTGTADLTCHSCHGFATDAGRLSGAHAAHAVTPESCALCHADLYAAGGAFAGAGLHLNGRPDIRLDQGIWDPERKSCATACHGGEKGWADEGYHAVGWAAADRHGAAFTAGPAGCGACHGNDLSGGVSGISCDRCHAGGSAWRNDCTFCHGGVDNPSGAPPAGVDGETATSERAVGAHTAHVAGSLSHRPFECTVCHAGYASFSDSGHIDGRAAVVLSGPAGPTARHDPVTGSCESVHCHGDGRQPSGAILWTADAAFGCGSCHGEASAPGTLSGRHAAHLQLSLGCNACHADVVDDAGTITGMGLHINGSADVRTVAGVWDPGSRTCADSCHAGVRTWSGPVHPAGWDARESHGHAFEVDPDGCRACHGADLTGGSSGVSCDACHPGGAAWRTDCTFCHGGRDTGGGAPPAGVRGETSRASRHVGAHTIHVTDGNGTHQPYGCALCHALPDSIDSQGHIDGGTAEVRLAAAAGPDAAYDPATTGCRNLYCHGNGRQPSGTLVWTSTASMTCHGCHGDWTTRRALSGAHVDHSQACATCHPDTVDRQNRIAAPGLHLNGSREVRLPAGVWDPLARTCSAGCHSARAW